MRFLRWRDVHMAAARGAASELCPCQLGALYWTGSNAALCNLTSCMTGSDGRVWEHAPAAIAP